jgi:hypothetical protein
MQPTTLALTQQITPTSIPRKPTPKIQIDQTEHTYPQQIQNIAVHSSTLQLTRDADAQMTAYPWITNQNSHTD